MSDLDPETRKLYLMIEARAGRALTQAELQRIAARLDQIRAHPGETWWWPTECAQCGKATGPWNPDNPGSTMTHIVAGGAPDWDMNRDHSPKGPTPKSPRTETQGWLTNPPSQRYRQAHPNTKEPKRVVLIEPGDVLLIGNIGEHATEDADAIGEWARDIGIRIALFAEAINIDTLKAAGLTQAEPEART